MRLTFNDLRADQTSLFLCEGGSDGDHAILVQGWHGVVMQYAADCIDCLDPLSVLDDAERQLADQSDADEWAFGNNGTAVLHISFEDGWWRCAKVTATPCLDLLPDWMPSRKSQSAT